MLNEGVYKVQYIMKSNGLYVTCIADLIFLDEVPTAVFSWQTLRGKQFPQETQTLDGSLLEQFQSGEITHLYHGLILDHRKVH